MGNNLSVLNCGPNAVWSTRTRMALTQLKSKYILFLLEDFYISQRVDTNKIQKTIQLMDDINIKYYKLLSLSSIHTPNYEDYKYLRIIPSNLRYGVSLMPAIWERDYFLSKIGDGDYNPWKFESDRNADAEKSDDTLIGLYDSRNILNICHMVVQGKFLPNAIKRMKKSGYVFINLKRPIIRGREYFKHSCIELFYNIQTRFPALKKLFQPLSKRFSISNKNR